VQESHAYGGEVSIVDLKTAAAAKINKIKIKKRRRKKDKKSRK
jgi:hypothetical protein